MEIGNSYVYVHGYYSFSRKSQYGNAKPQNAELLFDKALGFDENEINRESKELLKLSSSGSTCANIVPSSFMPCRRESLTIQLFAEITLQQNQ